MRDERTAAKRRLRALVGLGVGALLLSACGDDGEAETVPPIPAFGFAVFSDAHFYDPALGTTGPDFEADIAADRKMIAESSAINDAVIEGILASNAEFVLVAGDLTKDGVRQSHEGIAARLSSLEAAGKSVFVVPGNHDINNTHSYGYPASGRVLEPNVSPAEFESIYAEFGYAEALYRDPASLSYVAQPLEGVWILGLDSCNYDDRYPNLSRTGGSYKPETLQWIVARLEEAEQQGIEVIGLQHHGVVEHFVDMDYVFDDYLLYQWRSPAAQLADAGLGVVFTGHHHATDVSRFATDERHIIDVQTGSTVTWSCPYRTVRYDAGAGTMDISNVLVESVDYDTAGQPFQQYAYDFLAAGMPELVIEQLTELGLTQAQATDMEPIVTPTLLAYYHGDEPPQQDPALMAEIQTAADSADPIESLIAGLLLNIWNDETPDGTVRVDLASGAVD